MTVVARTFASIPYRSALDTWRRIIDLIAPDTDSAARTELNAITGEVCALVTDLALKDDPMVVYGFGPRVRIYCLYNDDAVEQDDVNESTLSFIPTDGDWCLSIPCCDEDLDWVRRSLSAKSRRVSVRALGSAVEGDEEPQDDDRSVNRSGISLDRDAFLRP
jgi:hypothetical protein